MSDTPTTDIKVFSYSVQDFYTESAVSVEFARQMERFLRQLRAHANNYVSPEMLREIDEFLNQTK
jgi:hypothetical protein